MSAMAVDNFKSAEELKLSERQRTALIKTLALMESRGISERKFIEDKKFSMNYWIVHKDECGTVCCIGGTATLLDGGDTTNGTLTIKSLFHDSNYMLAGGASLRNLFYVWGMLK